MGRGTTGSALLYGPTTRRGHQDEATIGFTLEEMRERYAGELEPFERLHVFPGFQDPELNELCRRLKGRTMLILAGSVVHRLDELRIERPTWDAEVLEMDTLITVVNATHAHTTTGFSTAPAHITWNDPGAPSRGRRCKANLSDVAVLSPESVSPSLPAR